MHMLILTYNENNDPYREPIKWNVCVFANKADADRAQTKLTAAMMVNNFDNMIMYLKKLGMEADSLHWIETCFDVDGCYGFGVYCDDVADGAVGLEML